MGIDIALPNITAPTEQGKLEQIRSYLYRLAEQLKWALNTLETDTASVVTQMTASASKKTPEAEAQSNFNSIKSLIITSADIVDAYYDVVNNRLLGEYSALSEFGTFTEKTELNFTATSKRIDALFDNQQSIDDLMYDIDAHIFAGMLYTDGDVEVYGLEIGQKVTKTNDDGSVEETFNKYARFTSDRLSFYDQNDIEVAYISDYKLYITNAEVRGELKLGGYKIDTSNGLVFTWEGGAS
jgi:hypothetical protein